MFEGKKASVARVSRGAKIPGADPAYEFYLYCNERAMIPMTFFLYVVSYLVGAIPFGYVVGKIVGVDVRQHGSKNIGATNVSRTLGKKWGVLTLLLDLLKGLLPMVGASVVLGGFTGNEAAVSGCGVVAVLGHMFPVYLKFKGGKGVATGLGVFCYLSPVAILISLVIFVVTVAVSGFVSAGSLLAAALFPLWLVLFGAPHAVVIAAVVVALLIWIKHHANIVRLLKGEEKSWRKEKN